MRSPYSLSSDNDGFNTLNAALSNERSLSGRKIPPPQHPAPQNEVKAEEPKKEPKKRGRKKKDKS